MKNEDIDPHSSPVSTTDFQILKGGKEYFDAFITIINEARHELHLQTYILNYDAIGTKVVDALIAASNRKVNVYLLLDAFGSAALPGEIMNKLAQHGIHCRKFSPLFAANSFYLGRRMHHKVLVADAQNCLIGGINIADKYHGNDHELPWLDYAVYLRNNTIGKLLETYCRNNYSKKRTKEFGKGLPAWTSHGNHKVRIVINDWLMRRNQIGNSYLHAIRNAKEDIVIISSYFLSGKRLFKAMKKASSRGVKIKLITSGVSDIPLFTSASRYLYPRMLAANIELFEWQQSVLHAKMAIVDGQWLTVGSFNLNDLSTYGSLEMNIEILSHELSGTYSSVLAEVLSHSQQIEKAQIKKSSLISKLSNWLAYWCVRIILNVFVVLPYNRIRLIQRLKLE